MLSFHAVFSTDPTGVSLADGPLAIVAQVTQGNTPIIGAKVE